MDRVPPTLTSLSMVNKASNMSVHTSSPSTSHCFSKQWISGSKSSLSFMNSRSTSIFKDPDVAKHLSLLHDKCVIVSADKASNNNVFVCKSHYIDCLIKELGIDNSLGNPTYTSTTLTKVEVLDNQVCFMFLWNFNHWWRTGSTITLLDS